MELQGGSGISIEKRVKILREVGEINGHGMEMGYPDAAIGYLT